MIDWVDYINHLLMEMILKELSNLQYYQVLVLLQMIFQSETGLLLLEDHHAQIELVQPKS